jgi:ribosomal protein S18 acetylase RimI-like enzyme
VGAWVEGAEGMPSSVLKGNLLNYTLPKQCIEKAVSLNSLVKDLHIEYINNTIQIGLVYVSAHFRGLGLANKLIEKQIEQLLQGAPEISECYVQVFGNNLAAIKSYEKSQFVKLSERRSDNSSITNYFPANSKWLMSRKVK